MDTRRIKRTGEKGKSHASAQKQMDEPKERVGKKNTDRNRKEEERKAGGMDGAKDGGMKMSDEQNK